MVRTRFTIAVLAAYSTIGAAAPTDLPVSNDARLTVEQARAYLIELINRDRAALGRTPVEADAVATSVAQAQAELMTSVGAISHADLSGRLPIQRYTEAGGKDRVRENVAVFGVKQNVNADVRLEDNPTFTRAEIEAVEAAYFNQVPPNHRHRLNILAPEHTHVGIGLARGAGDDAGVLGNAQEFVDRYIEELAPLPAEARVGESVVVGGRVTGNRRIVAFGVSREPLPRALSRTGYRAALKYALPSPYVKVWADDAAPAIRMSPGGRFRAELRLDDGGRAGLYYVLIWVHDPIRGEVLASARTVRVSGATAGKNEDGAWKP